MVSCVCFDMVGKQVISLLQSLYAAPWGGGGGGGKVLKIYLGITMGGVFLESGELHGGSALRFLGVPYIILCC